MLTKLFAVFSVVFAVLDVWAAPVMPANQLQGGGFSIHGKVSLPDGKPASRVTVKIDGPNGLHRETQSNNEGAYEFFNIPSGRYRLTATNSNDPTQYTDHIDADTSRAAGNRLLIHIYLRTPPAGSSRDRKPGVVTAAEALQNIPKKAQKAYNQGVKYKSENKIDQALKSFNQAIELYPEYFQAIAERGELHIMRGQVAEAAFDFDQALKLDKDYEPALRGAGFVKLQQQESSEAARYLEQAVAADPNNAKSHLYLGIADLMLNQYEMAKQSFEKALRINSTEAVTAHRWLSKMYALEEQYKEAADEIKAYLKALPNAKDADNLKALEADYRKRARAPKN